MDGFEINKMLGALLGTVLFVLVLMNVSDILFHQAIPETPGYVVEVPEEGATATAEAPKEETPLPVLLASADPAAGEKVAKKCASCHDFTNGGPNKVGPNLWGVVNRNIGAHEGFQYSDSMGGEAAKDGTWTFEHLFHFLADPKGYVPGTKMAFAGIKKPEDRADLLAYLRTLSDSPAPLPEPAAAEAPAAAAPAAEAPAAAAPSDAAPAENKPADAAPATDSTAN
ncbi:MAG: cytochrome c family protein [Rhodobiaceae bacterium]|nr:cytochrome c family protein [Rhodobiaceae bacterium]